MKFFSILGFIVIFNAFLSVFNVLIQGYLPLHFGTSSVYTVGNLQGAAGCAQGSQGLVCTQTLPEGAALNNILVFGFFPYGIFVMLRDFLVGLAFPGQFLLTILGTAPWSLALAAAISAPMWLAASIAIINIVTGRDL
jgi:hypothetical protein